MSNQTEYIAAVYRRNPNANSATVDRLASLARSLHRMYVNDCNGYQDWRGEYDEKAEKRAEKRKARLEAEAEKLAMELGAILYTQGDPRGWPLFLYFPGDIPEHTLSAACADGGYHGVGIPPR